MDNYSGVMVYGETAGQKLTNTTCELLECGRRLADTLGQSLSCVLTGELPASVMDDAASRGARTVYTAVIGKDAIIDMEGHLSTAVAAIGEAKPAIVLIGHTPLGRELGPRLAFRLGTAVATDCIDLKIDADSHRLVMTKPVYGGNAMADFVAEVMPQVATVRPKAMSAGEPSGEMKAMTVELSVPQAASQVVVKDRVIEEVTGVKLEDAAVVVSGGRGMGGPAPFTTLLKDLADVLHGAVGASRPACDNGWAPEAMHIGLTGKIVAPDLYIAVAISGASQHVAGCSASKTVVAINKDPEANIFREASYGVAGKFEDVLPAFTAKLKELLTD
ncbi:MAG: electron transfer flavoprotein subunit alpha/FixB family protein [Dehalococcoidia bacterium]|nr:electron transfer flavoprotein subunit alpha/FixB family protein [Dehalococcoidia bacterium]